MGKKHILFSTCKEMEIMQWSYKILVVIKRLSYIVITIVAAVTVGDTDSTDMGDRFQNGFLYTLS
jgi:hypothetical protein